MSTGWLRRFLAGTAAAGACAIAAAALPGVASAAPWCGSVSSVDRPAIAGGPQVKVIYAIPSDGVDASADWAPRISADLDEIDGWWRSHDGSRAPRFDRTTFVCGDQADIRLVRLPFAIGDMTAVTSPEAVYQRLVDLVKSLDPDPSQFKYLVYFDVRTAVDRVCGLGGGSFTGAGVAGVLTSGCPDVSTSSIAVHELLHAMGAVPSSGPPHACPESAAHVCDSTGDIMAMYAEYVPLTSLALDVNHDDYYAHGGSWLDMQDSAWLRFDQQVPITVVISGTGRVFSAEPGLDCTATCTLPWNQGAQVQLNATPADGNRFVGWTGPCAGPSVPCTVPASQAATVGAIFAPARFPLSVQVTGKGKVRATGTTPFVCGVSCAKDVPSHTAINLSATASTGWRFKGWAGGCKGAKPVCVPKMTAATTARAIFVQIPKKRAPKKS
jgi:Divergent InlB B-repeat domain